MAENEDNINEEDFALPTEDMEILEPSDAEDDGETLAEEEPAQKKKRKITRKRTRSARVRTTSRRSSRKSRKSRMQPVMRGELKNRSFLAVCSECYEEFIVDPNYKAEKFNCPECDHQAIMADEEYLRKFYGAKKNENFYLLMALVSFGVLALVFFVWHLVLVNPANADEGVFNWGFLFIMVLAFVSGIYFSIRYEIRRYEAYF
jgi:predicted RNA-binding Zn-ribbon protein involved in translation (DUF1610 family)